MQAVCHKQGCVRAPPPAPDPAQSRAARGPLGPSAGPARM